MSNAPRQWPHPLFRWLIPKELINMQECWISIGTKEGACTLALWRSIRNTKRLLRGKLSVSLTLGWAELHSPIKMPCSKHTLGADTGSMWCLKKVCLWAQKPHTQHRCRYLQMWTCLHKSLPCQNTQADRQFSVSNLFPSFSGPF